MAIYRKKPVEVEAIQVVKNSNGIVRVDECPDWWSDEVNARTIGTHVDSEGYVDGYLIHTLEGVMLASVGDYVIQGVKGELYPCKPDIFEQTYAPARPYYQEVYEWAAGNMECCDEPEWSLFSGIVDTIAAYAKSIRERDRNRYQALLNESFQSFQEERETEG